MQQMHSIPRPMKFIIVTGGVVSGVGKGVFASSLGVILKGRGINTTSIKIDPYINLNAGNTSPTEHGEVYILDDGGEVDMDLGNYERFLNITLTRNHNITTGKIYKSILEKERRGDYLGKTVQVIPHVVEEINNWIRNVAEIPVDDNGRPDVTIVELGGTIGDIESLIFIEALRQLKLIIGKPNFFLFHVSLLPTLDSTGEGKTKPTQKSVHDLRSLGLEPNGIVCRSKIPLSRQQKEKLSLYCQIKENEIFSIHEQSSIYHVPLELEKQNIFEIVSRSIDLESRHSDYLDNWIYMAKKFTETNEAIVVAIVRKYGPLEDAYHSLIKALEHACCSYKKGLHVNWVESEHLEQSRDKSEFVDAYNALNGADAIIIPSGFGHRGLEGMCVAAQYARENKIPFLGISLGMQVAVIEFCRNVLGLRDANSTEFKENVVNKVIVNMPETALENIGGTMRLGLRTTELVAECKVKELYGGASQIHERHRHRYEVSPDFAKIIDCEGMRFVGRDCAGERMEIFELENHPFYIGTQFQPEMLSRPIRPAPLFSGLIESCVKVRKTK